MGHAPQDEHVLNVGDLLTRYETSWPQVCAGCQPRMGRMGRGRQGRGPAACFAHPLCTGSQPWMGRGRQGHGLATCLARTHLPAVALGARRRAFQRKRHGSVWSAMAGTSSSAAHRAASRPSPCLCARPCVRSHMRTQRHHLRHGLIIRLLWSSRLCSILWTATVCGGRARIDCVRL